MKVDFSLLREIIGDDHGLAYELFQLFHNTAERCIEAAHKSMDEQAHKRWKDAIHELRGAAVNIGANGLAGVLQHAEALAPADLMGKTHALSVIIQEYEEASNCMKAADFGA